MFSEFKDTISQEKCESNTKAPESSNQNDATDKGAKCDISPDKNSHQKYELDVKSISHLSSKNWLQISECYKTRFDEFKKIFANIISSNEKLVADYSCILVNDVPVHGKLYLSLRYLCFYSKISGCATTEIIKFCDISAIEKAYTPKYFFSSAIQISIQEEKYIFNSFTNRDSAYSIMYKLWQNAVGKEHMTSSFLMSHLCGFYGDNQNFTMKEEAYANLILDYPKLGFHHFEMLTSEKVFDSNSSSDENCNFSENVTKENINEKTREVGDEVEIRLISSPEVPPCIHSTHEGIKVLDQWIPMPLEEVFHLIFQNNDFLKSFLEKRNASNVNIGEWEEVGQDDESIDFKQKRHLKFTLEINHTLAKSCNTNETQYILSESQPGYIYIVRSQTVNSGIPMCNNFMTIIMFCLTKGEDPNKSHLRVHGQVVFKKSVWGLKSIIEESSYKRMTAHCRSLVDELCNNVSSAPTTKIMHEIKKRIRKSKITGALKSKRMSTKIVEASWDSFLIKLVFGFVVLLFLLNLVLYMRMKQLEGVADNFNDFFISLSEASF